MSEKKKMVPQLRFPGFSGEWEERKLGVVANYRNGKAHENDIDEKGKYVVVNSKFVSTNGKVRKFSNKQNEPLFKNELAFVLSDVPNGKAIARTFLIDKDDKYTLNQRIAGIKPLENTNPYYLYILMNRHRYFLQFDDGAKQTNLTKEDVERFSSFYPLKAEQDRIGIYFEQLDHLIALQQRQLTHLQTRKKGLQQKMFPKDDELFPQLRFPGFTDAWKERELSEVVTVNSGRDYKHLNIGDIPVYGTGGYMLSVNEALSYDADGIGIGRKGTIDSPYILRAPFWTVDTLFYAIPKKCFDLGFIFTVFQNINWKKLDESTGVPSLSKAIINKIIRSFPTNEEQQKIGAFFKQLDDSITLHQRKLDHLQARKKALLQQMFV